MSGGLGYEIGMVVRRRNKIEIVDEKPQESSPF